MVSAGCYWIVNCMQYCSLFKDRIGRSGGHTLIVGSQHRNSLSGTLYGCATPPGHISGVVGMTCHNVCSVAIDGMHLVHCKFCHYWLGCVPWCQCPLVLLQAMFQRPTHLAYVHLWAGATGNLVHDTGLLLSRHWSFNLTSVCLRVRYGWRQVWILRGAKILWIVSDKWRM